MFLRKLWFAVSICVCYFYFQCVESRGIDYSRFDYKAGHFEKVRQGNEWKAGGKGKSKLLNEHLASITSSDHIPQLFFQKNWDT